jgi:hypothetical protein
VRFEHAYLKELAGGITDTNISNDQLDAVAGYIVAAAITKGINNATIKVFLESAKAGHGDSSIASDWKWIYNGMKDVLNPSTTATQTATPKKIENLADIKSKEDLERATDLFPDAEFRKELAEKFEISSTFRNDWGNFKTWLNSCMVLTLNDSQMKNVRGIEHFKSLKILSVKKCQKLESLAGVNFYQLNSILLKDNLNLETEIPYLSADFVAGCQMKINSDSEEIQATTLSGVGILPSGSSIGTAYAVDSLIFEKGVLTKIKLENGNIHEIERITNAETHLKATPNSTFVSRLKDFQNPKELKEAHLFTDPNLAEAIWKMFENQVRDGKSSFKEWMESETDLDFTASKVRNFLVTDLSGIENFSELIDLSIHGKKITRVPDLTS